MAWTCGKNVFHSLQCIMIGVRLNSFKQANKYQKTTIAYVITFLENKLKMTNSI